MKEIPLTQGMVALVDDEDYELVSQYRWQALRGRRTFYAQAKTPRRDGRQTSMSMHRLILGLMGGTLHADHINGDGLDNRRNNLRPATRTQNARNRRLDYNSVSGFKGVTAGRSGRGWQARIRVGNTLLHLGTFDTPQQAARTYDSKARDLFGEFAWLNFPDAERIAPK